MATKPTNFKNAISRTLRGVAMGAFALGTLTAQQACKPDDELGKKPDDGGTTITPPPPTADEKKINANSMADFDRSLINDTSNKYRIYAAMISIRQSSDLALIAEMNRCAHIVVEWIANSGITPAGPDIVITTKDVTDAGLKRGQIYEGARGTNFVAGSAAEAEKFQSQFGANVPVPKPSVQINFDALPAGISELPNGLGKVYTVTDTEDEINKFFTYKMDWWVGKIKPNFNEEEFSKMLYTEGVTTLVVRIQDFNRSVDIDEDRLYPNRDFLATLQSIIMGTARSNPHDYHHVLPSGLGRSVGARHPIISNVIVYIDMHTLDLHLIEAVHCLFGILNFAKAPDGPCRYFGGLLDIYPGLYEHYPTHTDRLTTDVVSKVKTVIFNPDYTFSKLQNTSFIMADLFQLLDAYGIEYGKEDPKVAAIIKNLKPSISWTDQNYPFGTSTNNTGLVGDQTRGGMTRASTTENAVATPATRAAANAAHREAQITQQKRASEINAARRNIR